MFLDAPIAHQLAYLALVPLLAIFIQCELNVLLVFCHFPKFEVDIGHALVYMTIWPFVLLVQQMHLFVELQSFFPLFLQLLDIRALP